MSKNQKTFKTKEQNLDYCMKAAYIVFFLVYAFSVVREYLDIYNVWHTEDWFTAMIFLLIYSLTFIFTILVAILLLCNMKKYHNYEYNYNKHNMFIQFALNIFITIYLTYYSVINVLINAYLQDQHPDNPPTENEEFCAV